jgi:hypothetical protein
VIQDLFARYLHRAANPAELANFGRFLLPIVPGGLLGDVIGINVLAPAALVVGEEQVAELLVTSQEYFVKRGGGTSQGFLNALCADALNRAPTAQELQQLGPPTVIRRVQAALRIFSGLEYRQVLVRGYNQRFLNRPATDAEVQLDANLLMRGANDEDVIGALVGSAEYFAQV